MKKVFLLGFAAACLISCNSNADTSTSGDSTSNMSSGGDTVSSGSSGSSGSSSGSSSSSSGSMQGTGTDTGYHGAGMDSSRMSNMDTTKMRNEPAR